MKNIIILLVALCACCVSVYVIHSEYNESLNVSDNYSESSGGVVNVYSSRKEVFVDDLFLLFTEKTKIKVNYITDNANNLISRIKSEGESTSADVFLASDVVNLIKAQNEELLQKIHSDKLNDLIPSDLRTEYWYAFTKRARVIVYAKDRVTPEEIANYEDLAFEKWQHRLLMRSSNSQYNQSLLSSIIASEGEPFARRWVRAIVANMARIPKGGDIDQIIGLASSEGDVSVVNTYYLARMLSSSNKEERDIAEKVGIIFPNQQNRGTMINISGAGVTKFSKNKENAIKFLEFMISPAAQKMYTEKNYEYPILKTVELSDILASWGKFKEDNLPLENLSKYLNLATKIADEEKWQ